METTKKANLKIRFHNPNTAEDTADYIVKVLMEANQKKVDNILKGAVSREEECRKSRIAV